MTIGISTIVKCVYQMSEDVAGGGQDKDGGYMTIIVTVFAGVELM